ncbi:MoaD/ThiS family protein [Thermogymnomonas acidicola]|uniref:MoaD/ThiS family protein n=1 Tax=Thermogymnomonas acidicola TaxID=399579 RepID=UPI0009462E06|nr:MoaD/ThiS family protein [Thermogymnomonas acidicola]
MKVTVRYFADYREAAGTEREEVEVPAGGASLADVIRIAGEMHPGLNVDPRRSFLSINAEFRRPEDIVRDGDEVAIMPMVSGGG